jgi:hypothetical protein
MFEFRSQCRLLRTILTEYLWFELSDACLKVKSLCLTKHHAVKAYWGVEVKLHSFFDFGTRY